MNTYQQNAFSAQQKPNLSQWANSPMTTAAQTSAQDAMAFQLWVSEQSHALGRLKVFHTMAKSIHDQQ